MMLSNIATIRLHSQQIAFTKFKTPKQIVHWMGAMQAQDYNMAKWAVGIRLPDSTDKLIQKAVDKAEIIRTHLLRPTWHFVSAEEIYWMLELTAPQIKTATRSWHKHLEFTDKILAKSHSIISKALEGGNHLTRQELMSLLQRAKILTNENRSAHIMLIAELDGIVCSGASKGNKQTYALLEERVPKKKSFTKDEALATLALKYFSSHCPATLQDFVWWSGLPVTAARHALEMVKKKFISETIGTQTYWLTNSFSIPAIINSSLYLLPAFDEFLVSYKDRTASLAFKHNRRSISINGIFWPVIVLNGQVVGLWKRTIKNNSVIIETEFFSTIKKEIKKLLNETAARFGSFLKKKIDVRITDY